MNYFFKSAIPLLLFLIVDISTIEGSPNVEETEKVDVKAEVCERTRGALGQGFVIHNEDLLGKEFKQTGAKIFEDFSMDECTYNLKLGLVQKLDKVFSNTESLYEFVASSTNVGKSLKGAYTLGVSVAAISNNIASSEEEVQGLLLRVQALSLTSLLKKDCINEKPLAAELVNDFASLDSKVERPWKLSSWRKYAVFLEKYGSHIVREAASGASIDQYVFTTGSSQYGYRDLLVKACLSLAGSKDVKRVGISACSGISAYEIAISSSKSMIKKTVVRGGKADTRVNLIRQHTKDKIDKFLEEALTSPSPIHYNFYPIWTILKAR